MIALLGGTFDPIHVGHLAAAAAARELLSVDRVQLVVAASPYHKQGFDRITPVMDRLAMVRLVCAQMSGLSADDSDLDHDGPSYTVDLLERMARANPSERRTWIIGEDAFAEILGWRRVERVFQLTGFLVFARQGYQARWSTALARFVASRCVAESTPPCHGQVMLVNRKLPDVSSTAIRARIRRGEPVDEWLHPAVQTYIQEHHLYEKTGQES